jgi:histidyl-tRNA synthetase
MSNNKPSVPKGTRDFSPAEMVKRNFIFDTIREVFRRYGYLPLETPAMENLDTLLGKYGEEGDKLLFKILNSGDFTRELDPGNLQSMNTNLLASRICEKGLRYDLTVPFARYVVQHQHEIVFPFKRYQIQPVWRADRPQKGRYREFYQCDADVIGSDSLFNEVELIQIMDEVFRRLGIRTVIKMNNRKVLSGFAEIAGIPERITDLTVAIDKLEKIGWEKVTEELISKGISGGLVEQFGKIFRYAGSENENTMNHLREIMKKSATGQKGIEELDSIFSTLKAVNLNSSVELNLALARGLNYYTGAIFEVKALDMEIGSICGGGRYDDLTGIFGLQGTSGVGISFGADRIFDVMNHLNLFPAEAEVTTTILFVNFGGNETLHSLKQLASFRDAGIRAEIYPDPVKLKKQIAWAVSRNIPFLALIGETELEEDLITLKRLSDGDQKSMKPAELLDLLRKIQ